MNVNKIFNGAKSFFAMLAIVALWVTHLSGVLTLPPWLNVAATTALGFITLLHAWKAQYGSEVADLGQGIGVDLSALRNGAKVIITLVVCGGAYFYTNF